MTSLLTYLLAYVLTCLLACLATEEEAFKRQGGASPASFDAAKLLPASYHALDASLRAVLDYAIFSSHAHGRTTVLTCTRATAPTHMQMHIRMHESAHTCTHKRAARVSCSTPVQRLAPKTSWGALSSRSPSPAFLSSPISPLPLLVPLAHRSRVRAAMAGKRSSI